jgi:hypothetical protein
VISRRTKMSIAPFAIFLSVMEIHAVIVGQPCRSFSLKHGGLENFFASVLVKQLLFSDPCSRLMWFATPVWEQMCVRVGFACVAITGLWLISSFAFDVWRVLTVLEERELQRLAMLFIACLVSLPISYFGFYGLAWTGLRIGAWFYFLLASVSPFCLAGLSYAAITLIRKPGSLSE